MESSIPKPSSPNAIRTFLHNLKTDGSRLGVHERDTMWLLFQFMKAPTTAAIWYRINATEHITTQKKDMLKTYCQSVNYVLETYESDDSTTVSESNITCYKHPKLGPTVVTQRFSERALECKRAYEKSRLNGVLIERLHNSIRFSTTIRRNPSKHFSLQNLAGYATSAL